MSSIPSSSEDLIMGQFSSPQEGRRKALFLDEDFSQKTSVLSTGARWELRDELAKNLNSNSSIEDVRNTVSKFFDGKISQDEKQLHSTLYLDPTKGNQPNINELKRNVTNAATKALGITTTAKPTAQPSSSQPSPAITATAAATMTATRAVTSPQLAATTPQTVQAAFQNDFTPHFGYNTVSINGTPTDPELERSKTDVEPDDMKTINQVIQELKKQDSKAPAMSKTIEITKGGQTAIDKKTEWLKKIIQLSVIKGELTREKIANLTIVQGTPDTNNKDNQKYIDTCDVAIKIADAGLNAWQQANSEQELPEINIIKRPTEPHQQQEQELALFRKTAREHVRKFANFENGRCLDQVKIRFNMIAPMNEQDIEFLEDKELNPYIYYQGYGGFNITKTVDNLIASLAYKELSEKLSKELSKDNKPFTTKDIDKYIAQNKPRLTEIARNRVVAALAGVKKCFSIEGFLACSSVAHEYVNPEDNKPVFERATFYAMNSASMSPVFKILRTLALTDMGVAMYLEAFKKWTSFISDKWRSEFFSEVPGFKLLNDLIDKISTDQQAFLKGKGMGVNYMSEKDVKKQKTNAEEIYRQHIAYIMGLDIKELTALSKKPQESFSADEKTMLKEMSMHGLTLQDINAISNLQEKARKNPLEANKLKEKFTKIFNMVASNYEQGIDADTLVRLLTNNPKLINDNGCMERGWMEINENGFTEFRENPNGNHYCLQSKLDQDALNFPKAMVQMVKASMMSPQNMSKEIEQELLTFFTGYCKESLEDSKKKGEAAEKAAQEKFAATTKTSVSASVSASASASASSK